ncbi:AEC family transporter [Pelistega europaea]|uniref:AEC family transporter n=1 Tax=Pelistega europaea TaxID=106147 RepID=A0A7Y4P351_9BURK|nr:AEC family transporter [Pelistega europaea]NOL48657.1 AEC family transporter [Pelistega europaea]
MWEHFHNAFVFGLAVTLPSVLLLVLGWYLRRTKQVDVDFCDKASKIVFRYSMPALLFFSIYSNKSDFASQFKLVLAGVIASFILFIGAEIVARYTIRNASDKGVFVQGVFRANTMIMGLAFISSAYGQEGVAMGAVYGGAMTLLFNVLAVLTLSHGKGGQLSFTFVMKQIFKNPLILSILAALLCKFLKVPVSPLLAETGHYLAVISLPMALICAGATLNVRTLLKVSDIALWSSIGRLVVAPIVGVLCGLALGLEGTEMGVLYLMSATPVAAASYVMAKAMGSNDVAAANILGMTTVGALPMAALGITVMRLLGWM